MPKSRECKDCRLEGRVGPRLNAPYPGPRCYRHHLARRRVVSERAAADRRVRTYGLPPDAYERILEVQGGHCAICRRKPGKRRLAVDHDHSCCPGKTSCGACVRGCVCWTCNKFLEHIRDDPELAQGLANYLQDPPAAQVLL